MKPLFLAIAWALSLFLSAAPIRHELGGNPGDSARIVVECFVDQAPQRGFLPIRVRIVNRTDRSGTWGFQFTSGPERDGRNQTESAFSVDLEPAGARSVEWMVPMHPGQSTPQEMNYVYLSVTGPGGLSILNTEILGRTLHGWSNEAGPFVALSESMSLMHREALLSEIFNTNLGQMVRLARMDLDMLPEDPVGLSGIDVLVMTPEEWRSLARGARQTLRVWMAQGGWILLSGAGGEAERLGLGGVVVRKEGLTDAVSSLRALCQLPTVTAVLSGDRQAYLPVRWSLRSRIPEIRRPVPLLMLFVLLVAGLLGPANLWFAHKRRNPVRVLWTTPLLSLVLSLALVVFIVLMDGFGGRGHRSLAVLLLPTEQREVLLQEQVSRTGVLLGDRFRLDKGVVMVPVDCEGSPAFRQSRFENAGRYWMNPDGETGGDWFRSRRIQAQVLRHSRPSRARVQIVPGNPQRIYSSVGTPLEDLVIRDAQGAYWHAERVEAGQRVELKSIDAAQALIRLKALSTREDGLMAEHIQARGFPGWFYARATAAGGDFIETLPSIRWEQQPVVWLGPLLEGGLP